MENQFLNTFQNTALPAETPAWLKEIKSQSIARFSEIGIPDRKNEEWKYTNAKKITEQAYQPALADESIELPKEVLDYIQFPELTLVFINGVFNSTHSSLSKLPKGITVETLSQGIKTHESLIKPILADYTKTKQAFSALNNAFVQDGVLIHIDEKTEMKEPIHIVYVTAPLSHNAQRTTHDASPHMVNPRTFVILEKLSQAKILESYISFSNSIYFTNAVTDIVLKPGAQLQHYRVQSESSAAFHIGSTQVQQDRDSSLESFVLATGGQLSRHNLEIKLDGEGSTATFNGLYLGDGNQHIDNQTHVDHLKPNCNSSQLYKGILGGKAHGVFSGRIDVERDAQKTDAQQTNKNLLLTKEAQIDTKPQLNISADDVKCSHGATVGQLNDEELFYFQSRAIPKDVAIQMLVQGFAEDVLFKISDENIRQKLHTLLAAKLK